MFRLYKLPQPDQVVFDEVHVGGFVHEYFHGRFFVDVHPPLAKLVYYYLSTVGGYDGAFQFRAIGDVFDLLVPYVAMRAFSAVCGALTVVLAYAILRATSCRPSTAYFGAVLALAESSLATQSRLMLLDAPLVFFTAFATLAFHKFHNAEPFSVPWIRTLLATGIALGLATATKLTGLFTWAWVLFWSAVQLWLISGDLDVSWLRLIGHVFTRLFGLVAVPLTVYCGVFAIHFKLLPNSGSGSVSPQFSAEFADSDLTSMPVDVSYGSQITLRHHRTDMYLHSHNFKYKTGTHQQQVTLYGFEGDPNSRWVIETSGTNYDGKFDTKFRPIKDGDVVKLYHRDTKKYLRSSDVRPPNSEHDYSNEVSCDGNRTNTAENNFEWKVKIVGRKPHAENELPLRKLRATESVFQLVHRGTNCVLMAHDTHLPDWAFHQNQVLCVNDPTLPNTLWYIERNSHPLLDKDSSYDRVKLPRLLFWAKMVQYHHAMWRANKAYTKEHPYASGPISWPFVVRGISYFSNTDNRDVAKKNSGIATPQSHIYFLGNVVVYYAAIFAGLAFFVRFGLYTLRHLNPFGIPSETSNVTKYNLATAQHVSAWAFHYLPYFHMNRQLYAHHYLPCVLYCVLTVAQTMEYHDSVRPNVSRVAKFVLAGGALWVFWHFLPLVYGLAWTIQQCQSSKWFPTWDFDCMAYQ